MNVTVVGAGYVGLVTAACLADLGHRVVGVDRDHGRVALLQAGGVPIYEPGLDELVRRNQQAGRLRFTTALAQAVPEAEVLFIAVGTPPQEDGSADLQHVLDVARQVGRNLRGFQVVVNKSTVPVGTGDRVQAAIAEALRRRSLGQTPFAVVSNPEFLKEGAAIDDFMRPDRIVVGLPDGPEAERARAALTQLYAPFNRHHERTVWMDRPSAELTKYAANAMLATRISFMNEMALLADQVGADIDAVRRGIGADHRIGHSFLYAGMGYGGSCFPKDTRALVHTAAEQGLRLRVVEAVERVNRAQKQRLVQHLLALFGPDLHGRRFAVWGLAFKPQTNDMREAPSRTVVSELLRRGAEVVAHDPVAGDEARRCLAQDLGGPLHAWPGLRLVDDPHNALDGAHALLLLTEWKCFHNPDWARVVAHMADAVVLDGRNLYDPAQLQAGGVAHIGIGRRNALGQARLDAARSGRPQAAVPPGQALPL
ncbi:UDP-glucose/GDP-mannose dehydrogenase family protein [Aquabacterium sp. A08]|uniref:UDP-glucose dehydrogenase family protein n=1 Tax=Aquabacterium sp. A08 TaxID=2718532 RepID=UPI0014227835|nr:UDP-glucose/GDP-mannose dehydrogenase family protein [Aquabacterium sp. A08]NIC40096.1 UDP-glucose/GDP-mannose dehydrogenase family protein [Aquabacterium sp. A08]